MKFTKIVCTIGPASKSEEVLRKLVQAGMNVARLNFSHGTHDEHADLIKTIRKVSEELKEPVAILQDLQGPKIRVGELPKEGVTLVSGGQVVFTTGTPDIPNLKLPVTYEKLHQDVKAGERILLDDGLLSAQVLSVDGHEVTCKVIDGGKLTSHKGVNFPDSKLTVSSITEKDMQDLQFGVAQQVDYVALSFVRHADEIHTLRKLINTYAEGQGIATQENASPTCIIAKIEKGEGVDNIDSIIEAVDVIMVARGDLGIETPAEGVPLIQKMLIRKCLAASKPVIVATQMLDSMIRNPRATRAEVSDVANAIIDHTDAVMLSGESAGGSYPVEAVITMSAVAAETERSPENDLRIPQREAALSMSDALAEMVNLLVRETDAKAVVSIGASVSTIRQISRFRPEKPIYAVMKDGKSCRQTNLSWAVRPMVGDNLDSAFSILKSDGKLAAGDQVIVVTANSTGAAEDVRISKV